MRSWKSRKEAFRSLGYWRKPMPIWQWKMYVGYCAMLQKLASGFNGWKRIWEVRLKSKV